MNSNVPGPVATYLAAEKSKDTEMLGQCFRKDAFVRDEGREHRGVAAIKAWHREVNAKFRYVVEPLEASVDGPAVVVRARVTGDFPGSPVEMRFNFTVSEDRIVSLEVTP
jgi:hypothetical protein